MTPPDYGEPWTLGEGTPHDRFGHFMAPRPRPQYRRRIVECVNACAGADDPQPGELLRLRAEVARLMGADDGK